MTKYYWVDEKSSYPTVISNYESTRNMAGNSQNWVRFTDSQEAHNFTKTLKNKNYKEKQREREVSKKEKSKKREKPEKKKNKEENNERGKKRFHLLYCLLVGWWLAPLIISCIVPLFFSGGRRLIKKAFGIW